jgi:hydrogenase expression/formation protein HypD
MKFLAEYRDADLALQYAQEIARVTTRAWRLMEVCGGQTHAILKFGIDELLPKNIELIHGPGCPVCVTPVELIDKALKIAAQPEVIFCSYGDMLRVPGSHGDLASVKAAGADVRMVYSTLDAVRLAQQNPGKQVVFFGVGFETTAPATAMAVYDAFQKELTNFFVLVSHVLVPAAMETILASRDCRVQGFLAAGHVCAVTGFEEYVPMAAKYRAPIVVTGFEPADILQGVLMCVKQLEAGRSIVENQYTRVVRRDGNVPARRLVEEVFRVVSRKWRGMGEIPASGLALQESYAHFDAERRFGLSDLCVEEPAACQSGLVLQGSIKPTECPSFGNDCTPEHPLGATMVSSEGACAAYYRYRRPERIGR